MNKVVFYSQIIRPGGGPSGYVYNLMKAAESFGGENVYYFCGHKFDDRSANNPNTWPILIKAEVYLTARGIYLPIFPDILDLKRISKNSIVVLHGPAHPRISCMLKNRAFRLVFMPHSPSLCCDEYIMSYASSGRFLSKRRYDYFKWAEHTSISYADHIIFPSYNAALVYKHAYSDQLNINKTYYIPSGVISNIDDYSVNNSYRKNKKEIVVGFIGRYNYHKGYDLYCGAAEKMSSCTVRFLSFGAGPLKSSGGFVEDRGWVNDISSAILECDIIVSPNRVCYYDLLPLEAASYGRPIVFTPVGGNIDQSDSLPDSILCKSVGVDDLVSGIEDAVNRKVLDFNWGITNRKKYLEIFTEKAMLKRWDEFINSIA
jgi:glycosyltransferase involved in cell wall biosynthesis